MWKYYSILIFIIHRCHKPYLSIFVSTYRYIPTTTLLTKTFPSPDLMSSVFNPTVDAPRRSRFMTHSDHVNSVGPTGHIQYSTYSRESSNQNVSNDIVFRTSLPYPYTSRDRTIDDNCSSHSPTRSDVSSVETILSVSLKSDASHGLIARVRNQQVTPLADPTPTCIPSLQRSPSSLSNSSFSSTTSCLRFDSHHPPKMNVNSQSTSRLHLSKRTAPSTPIVNRNQPGFAGHFSPLDATNSRRVFPTMNRIAPTHFDNDDDDFQRQSPTRSSCASSHTSLNSLTSSRSIQSLNALNGPPIGGLLSTMRQKEQPDRVITAPNSARPLVSQLQEQNVKYSSHTSSIESNMNYFSSPSPDHGLSTSHIPPMSSTPKLPHSPHPPPHLLQRSNSFQQHASSFPNLSRTNSFSSECSNGSVSVMGSEFDVSQIQTSPVQTSRFIDQFHDMTIQSPVPTLPHSPLAITNNSSSSTRRLKKTIIRNTVISPIPHTSVSPSANTVHWNANSHGFLESSQSYSNFGATHPHPSMAAPNTMKPPIQPPQRIVSYPTGRSVSNSRYSTNSNYNQDEREY